MRFERQLMAAALLLALGGCETDPGFGNAVRHNMALQIINPDPQYDANALEADSGARAALAQRRYRTGTVIQPAIQSTSVIAGFESGSSGGNGAGAGASTPPR